MFPTPPSKDEMSTLVLQGPSVPCRRADVPIILSLDLVSGAGTVTSFVRDLCSVVSTTSFVFSLGSWAPVQGTHPALRDRRGRMVDRCPFAKERITL